jgi:chemotaxis protein methyltransferase CheR
MTVTLDNALMGEVSKFIAERMGLHFPEERWPYLADGLKTAAPELGFEDAEACARWLITRQPTVRQIETLASFLTVGETYFFRDPASFQYLEQEILPRLVASRAQAGRTLRLWSLLTGHHLHALGSQTRRVERLRTCHRHQPQVSRQGRCGRLF